MQSWWELTHTVPRRLELHSSVLCALCSAPRPLPKAVGARVSLQCWSPGCALQCPRGSECAANAAVPRQMLLPECGCPRMDPGSCWGWSFPLSLPFMVSTSQGYLQNTSPGSLCCCSPSYKGSLRREISFEFGDTRAGSQGPSSWSLALHLSDPAAFLTKAYLGSKPEVFFGDLAPTPAGLGGESPLLQLCLLSPFVLSFLNRPFRIVFNIQQSPCLVVFLTGFQMIRKKVRKKES